MITLNSIINFSTNIPNVIHCIFLYCDIKYTINENINSFEHYMLRFTNIDSPSILNDY